MKSAGHMKGNNLVPGPAQAIRELNSAPRQSVEKTATLVGNPNSGKTSLFNQMTGGRQKVGNWGGVTVDIRDGRMRKGRKNWKITDLPGTYSLTAYSLEERVARDFIVMEKPDAVINVVDATNLERHLYLTLQLLELGGNIVLALNMSDETAKNGIIIDTSRLGELLGLPVVPTVGRTGKNVESLIDTAGKFYNGEMERKNREFPFNHSVELEIDRLAEALADSGMEWKYPLRWMAIKLLENDSQVLDTVRENETTGIVLGVLRKSQVQIRAQLGEDAETHIAEARYGIIRGITKETVRKNPIAKREMTDRIDAVLTNRALAVPLFGLFMWVLFQATFKLGEYPMGLIENGVAWLGALVSANMPSGDLHDLIVDGVIGGVGGVIVFLPNILILFLGVSLMEDTGYMARAAFIMDKLMHYMGLHGKSFIPMVMGFGCNVPAIMAARTLESKSDRILTILLAPLASCSARLPVYVLFAGAFFSKHAGNVIFSMYLIGIGTAFLLGMLFRKTLFRGEEYPFVMELPPYRLPTIRSLFIHVWEKGKHYLKKMGGVVLVFSVILWFMGAFPKNAALEAQFDSRIEAVQANTSLSAGEVTEQTSTLETEKNSALMRQSAIGRLGRIVEPVIRPLGFGWQAGVSLITGFVAKEVVVSSMGVLFNAERKADEGSEALREKLKGAFTPLTAFAFMLFVLFYTPCIVALVTLIREIQSWKFSLFSVGYQLVLAWVAAFIVVQGGRLIGLE